MQAEHRKEAAVLLITFNRPEYTRFVFEKIKQNKVATLYISNDAPRKDNKEDENAREEIKKLITEVDWNKCLGCRHIRGCVQHPMQ